MQEEQAAKEAQKEREAEEKKEALKLYSQQEREKKALQLLKQVWQSPLQSYRQPKV